MLSPSIDRDTFLKHLRASGLLSKRDFKAAAARLPDTQRGRVAARTLVEWGLITKFQAELLLIGRTQGFFLGQYRILDSLGQGGMGRVYKALHEPMNRVVALKILTPQVTKTTRAQQLFQREVQAAAQLLHPNIVTAYDAGQFEGRHYLAMEYVDGPNLEELVRAQGPLPVGLACELIRQAACGLQHAFEMGMLHRDIKPANLLVQQAAKKNTVGIVKILDFGLARLQEPSAVAPSSKTIIARDNVVMGTPDFIAPEQARDLHKTDIRSDLYSLGCSFYWLLTGKVPFPGGTVLEKFLRHSTEPPPLVSQSRDDVPDGVMQILGKLLAKGQAARFSTPQELVDAIAPFAQPAALAWDETRRTAHLSATTPIPAEDDASPTTEGVDTWPASAAVTPLATDSLILTVVRPGEKRRRWYRAACYIAAGLGLAGTAIAAYFMTP